MALTCVKNLDCSQLGILDFPTDIKRFVFLIHYFCKHLEHFNVSAPRKLFLVSWAILNLNKEENFLSQKVSICRVNTIFSLIVKTYLNIFDRFESGLKGVYVFFEIYFWWHSYFKSKMCVVESLSFAILQLVERRKLFVH